MLRRCLPTTALLVFLASVPAASLGAISAVSFFDGSGRIARVRLEGSRQLEYEFEGETKVCGWAYSAVVVESYRGQIDAFEFLSEEQISAESSREFLLFVEYYDPDETGDPIAGKSEARSAYDACTSSVRYFSAWWGRSVYPIRRAFADLFGPEVVCSEIDDFLSLYDLAPNKCHELAQVLPRVHQMNDELDGFATRRPFGEARDAVE